MVLVLSSLPLSCLVSRLLSFVLCPRSSLVFALVFASPPILVLPWRDVATDRTL